MTSVPITTHFTSAVFRISKKIDSHFVGGEEEDEEGGGVGEGLMTIRSVRERIQSCTHTRRRMFALDRRSFWRLYSWICMMDQPLPISGGLNTRLIGNEGDTFIQWKPRRWGDYLTNRLCFLSFVSGPGVYKCSFWRVGPGQLLAAFSSSNYCDRLCS